MIYNYLDSPIGELLLVGDGEALTALYTAEHARRPVVSGTEDPLAFSEVRRQLVEYFDGRRRVFDLQLRPAGTAFQQTVWSELTRIEYAETASYAEIAERIDNPRAVRAVGAANGRNPISIIVPCHRVVGSNGSLTGYAGGVEAKRWLLEHEHAHAIAKGPQVVAAG